MKSVYYKFNRDDITFVASDRNLARFGKILFDGSVTLSESISYINIVSVTNNNVIIRTTNNILVFDSLEDLAQSKNNIDY